jgi:homoserine O-succinyltransferase/O-acetyltransferase
MPVIVNSEELHPFLPSLGSKAAIERLRAEHQDIRPLEIAIINLMADKIAIPFRFLGHFPRAGVALEEPAPRGHKKT